MLPNGDNSRLLELETYEKERRETTGMLSGLCGPDPLWGEGFRGIGLRIGLRIGAAVSSSIGDFTTGSKPVFKPRFSSRNRIGVNL